MLLYHGTSMAFLPSIMKHGLKPRLGEVCLTDDFKLATVFAFQTCLSMRIVAQGDVSKMADHYPIVIPVNVTKRGVEKVWEGFGYYYASSKLINPARLNFEGIRRWDYDDDVAQGVVGYLIARNRPKINK